jgi:hypothetical protein
MSRVTFKRAPRKTKKHKEKVIKKRRKTRILWAKKLHS